MLGEAEQRKRFAYALQQALDRRGKSQRQLAKEMGISDARRIARWLSQKDLPNLFESQGLAAALRVDEELFRNPPPVPEPPPYPLDEYLLEKIPPQGPIASGAAEGRRRAAERLGDQGRDTPARRPARRARAIGEELA